MILSSVNLSATTAKPSLIEDIDYILGTDSTQYPLADKLRNINSWHYVAVTDILESMSNWEWDDTNKTDFPVGTTTLVVGQRDYSLPSDFLKLLRVEVLDVNGNYQPVHQFDEQEVGVALSEFMKTNGLPLYYREIGSSLELYPSPSSGSVTLAAGLKVYYVRTQTEFTTSDATVSPGFPAVFHRLLSYGASYDHASFKMTSNPTLINNIAGRIKETRASLQKYYASRNREVRTVLKRTRRVYE